MPDIEINPSLVRSGLEAGEKFLARRSSSGHAFGDKDFTTDIGRAVHQTVGMNNTWTGESGKLMTQFQETWKNTRSSQLAQIHGRQGPTMQSGLYHSLKPEEVHTMANGATRNLVSGPNDQVALGILKAGLKEHGPFIANMWAMQLQDLMGDVPQQHLEPKWVAAGTPGAKYTISGKAYKMEPTGAQIGRLQSNIWKDPDLQKPFEDMPSPMSKETREGGRVVRAGAKIANYAYTPRAVLKHIPQYVGLTSNASPASMWDTLTGMFGKGREETLAIAKLNGAMGLTLDENYRDLYSFQTSKIAKIAPGKFGQWLHRNVLSPSPLLNGLRGSLSVGASAEAQSILEYSAYRLAQDPKDRIANLDLKYLNVDPNEFMAYSKANGGRINPDHYQAAIDTNIRQKVFTGNPEFQSRWQHHPLGKAMSQYHYVSVNQRAFLQREIVHALKTRNMGRIMSTFASLAIKYPAVSYAVYELAKFAGGRESVADLKEKALHPIDAITDGKNMVENLHYLMEMTGLGILYSHIDAMAKRRYAETLLGPLLSAPIKLGQDIGAGIKGQAAGQEHPFTPLARDAIDDIPWIGLPLGHHFFPTKAEQMAKRPMTIQRLRGQKAAATRKARKKALESQR